MVTAGTSEQGERVIAIECNGARASIRTSTRELREAVVDHALPLGWAPSTPAADDRVFSLAVEADGSYAVSNDGEVVGQYEFVEVAVEVLRSSLFMHALTTPRGRVFVHAGCVGHEGSAILLPGYAGAGKTTLVAALVRAGAVYYTDDYAPLDADGLVHPYPLPLWLSDPGAASGGPRSAEDLGGTVGEQPLPVALVAQIVFREGGGWEVRRHSASQGTLLLFEHALNPQRQPEFALRAMRGAATGALVLQGERGDAKAAAATLLELAEGRDQVGP